MKHLVTAICVITFLAVLRSTQAVKCYKCESNNEGPCKDPFNAAGVGTCDGGQCLKGVGNFGVPGVLRDCVDASTNCGQLITDYGEIGYTVESCNLCSADLCNGNPGSQGVTQGVTQGGPLNVGSHLVEDLLTVVLTLTFALFVVASRLRL